MNEHKTNAPNLEKALKELQDIRPDVAKAFLKNHNLPDEKPFDKTKMISDASLWSELQELIAHFTKYPKSPISSMQGKQMHENLIPLTFEEFINESGRSAANALLKEIQNPKELEMTMFKYLEPLTDAKNDAETLAHVEAILNGLIAGLRPMNNSQFVNICLSIGDATKEIKKFQKKL